jgi:hypothetical protein
MVLAEVLVVEAGLFTAGLQLVAPELLGKATLVEIT